MKELLDNTARVCDMNCRVTFDISTKKKSRSEIAVSVLDVLLQNTAMHKGYLAQANHLLSTGVYFHDLIELERAICEVEHENGPTFINLYKDLRMNNDGLSCAAAKSTERTEQWIGLCCCSVCNGGWRWR
jgi:hypothetical protein